MTDANDLLMGSGVPAAKFETIGALVRGTVVKTRIGQQRDWRTKEPLYWNDGRPGTIVNDQPVMQAIVTVQTDERDGPTDDGHRDLYCGSINLREAVKSAVLAAGEKAIEVGGTVAVQYVAGRGETGDPKQYKAEYAPPAIGVGLLGGSPPATPPPAAPAAQPAPVQQPAAAAPPAGSLLG